MLYQDKSGNPAAKEFAPKLFFSLRRDVVVVCRVARWFVFKPKNTNLGKFWRALDGKMSIYLMAIWNILRPFGIF
jgi:hypothetical protein